MAESTSPSPSSLPAVAMSSLDADKAADKNVAASPTSASPSSTTPVKQELAGYLELFRYADSTDKLCMVVGGLFAVGYGVIQPCISLFIGGVTDAFITYGRTMMIAASMPPSPATTALIDEAKRIVEEEVLKNVYLFVGVGCAAYVAAYGLQALWILAGERQGHRVRTKFLQAILRQDVAYFDDNEVGDLTTRLSSDCTLYQEGISEKVGLAISSVSTFIAGFVIAFVQGWQLTLMLLALMPVLGVAGAFVGKVIASGAEESQQAYAKAGAIAQESLANIRTLVAFNAQERVLQKFDRLLEVSCQKNEAKAWKTGAGFGVFFSFLFLFYAVAFGYGAVLVNDGVIEGGDIINVIFAVIIGAFSIIGLAPSIQAISKARGVALKLYKVIESEPVIQSTTDEGKTLDVVSGKIEFRNVTFAYPKRPDVKVLDQFFLTVEPGETVALVGFSGSGKSTIIQLLERFYDPAEGEILVDGVPLKELNVKRWRQNLGLVSQEPILFDTSIEENVRFGVTQEKPVTEEDIIRACKISNAHGFVSKLPNGYKTLTGERGSLLSGGQKQRIAIARAIMNDPKILMLDEATSALDTESEALVQKALDSAAKNRTTIVIAHRLSTIKNANKIIVMQAGKIVETGTHESLIAKKGYYADLVRTQEMKTKQTVADVDTAVKVTDDDEKAAITSPLSHSSAGKYEGKVADPDDVAMLPEDERQRLEMLKVLKDTKVPLWRILQMQRPEAALFALAMFVSILNGAILPGFGVIFGEVLGVFAKRGQELIDAVLPYVYLFIGLTGVNFIVNLLQFGLFGVLGERLTRRIRYTYLQAMFRQNMSFFDEKLNGTGALTARLSDDADKIQGLTALSMGSIIQLVSSMCVALGLAFYYSWQMTLVVLATLPFFALGGIIESKMAWSSSNDPEVRKAYAYASQTACDAIANIRTVKSLTIEVEVVKQYLAKIALPHQRGIKRAWVASAGFGFSQAIQFWVYAVAFYAGFKFVMDGTIAEPQRLFTVLFAIVFGAIAFSQAAQLNSNISKARYAAINYFKLIDVTPTIDAYSADGERPGDIKGSAALDGVEFSYPQRADAPILRGISANVPAGNNVALVGPSGSGKSTVIALLERFYDTTAGTASVEHVDVKKWNLSHLRDQMSIVSQEPTLFIGSIRSNIAYARPNASDEEIFDAAKLANIHTFISELPEGYATEISNSRLSGGQKQRIAIARALLCKPKILLLDEATSALDSESEKIVQEALNNASQGRTTITIAHRLSTIQNADLILVVRDGVLVEQGKHFELIEKKGLYATLVDKQKLGTEK